MSDYDFDVVISGYGPTGQAAASLLSRLGHSVCVFERWSGLYGLPRLCTLDGEAARIIQAAGDPDVAFRNSNANKRYELVNEDGDVLIVLDWDLDHVCGFPYRIAMYQPDIEDALDARARELGAEINQGWQVTSVIESDDGVEVTARPTVPNPETKDLDLTDAEPRTVRARYVLGADGARSAIRESLGIEREDFGYRNAWLSLDAVRKRTPLPTLFGSEDLRGAFVVCAPEGRTRAVIPIGSDRLRFEFVVDPTEDHKEDLDPEVGYRYLEEAYGLTKDDVELYRSVIYPFEGQLAKSWRKGRVFIGGDAAHLMTPFLGQGACSALRDAVNLSWKLDLVLRGISDDSLLDTYEQERSPHVRVHVVVSNELGKMAMEPDPEMAAKRDEMFLSGNAPPPPPDPFVETGILHLEGAERAVPPIGDIGPQAVVSYEGKEGRFDDVFGWGFQLIGLDFDPGAELDDENAEFFGSVHGISAGVGTEAGDGVAIDVTGNYRSYFEEHDAVALLVRPDFVIFGLARSAGQVNSLVTDLRGQLAGSGKLSGAAA
jgi:3-(3-hydroxy-phenyl)propionate hydroxylase